MNGTLQRKHKARTDEIEAGVEAVVEEAAARFAKLEQRAADFEHDILEFIERRDKDALRQYASAVELRGRSLLGRLRWLVMGR